MDCNERCKDDVTSCDLWDTDKYPKFTPYGSSSISPSRKKSNKEIIKPYDWEIGTIHGHTKEETIKAWDDAWEFINKIDILSEYKLFMETNSSDDLYVFMEYLREKYEYHDCIGDDIFNIINTEEFDIYLNKKYSDYRSWGESVEIRHFEFNNVQTSKKNSKDGFNRFLSVLKKFSSIEEVIATVEVMEYNCEWNAETFCNQLANDLEEEISYVIDVSK